MSYQAEGNTPVTSETPAAPAKGYNEKQAKRNLHLAFFIILCALTGIAAFAAFLNFCLSMSQVSSSTVLANGESVWESENSSCKDVKTFWPLRWEIATQPDVVMKCPWPVGNSAFRSLMSIVAMGAIGLFIVVLKKPETRWLNWTFLGVSGVIGLLYFVIAITDGVTLHRANTFCEDGMPEAAALFKPELKGERK